MKKLNLKGTGAIVTDGIISVLASRVDYNTDEEGKVEVVGRTVTKAYFRTRKWSTPPHLEIYTKYDHAIHVVKDDHIRDIMADNDEQYKVGDTAVFHAAAPGYGRELYLVTAIKYRGGDRILRGYLYDDTVEVMTEADVI